MTAKQEERKGYNPLLKNYPDSVRINRVSIGAETLYTRLLARSDDYGDYDADPRLILAGLYGKRWKNRQVSELKIKKWVDELEVVNLVIRYQVDDDIYLHLVDCFKTLRSDIKRDVRYPKYSPELLINTGLPVHGTDTGRTRPPNQTRLDQTRLDQYVHLFNKFWKQYPRKDAKQRAVRWFEKNKPTGEDVGKMVFTIERQKKKGQRLCCERKFMPLPETWLNDGDWRDAPTQADIVKQVEDKAAQKKIDIEKEKQTIRESVIGIKLKGMTTKELKEILASKDMMIKRQYFTEHWLIKEILSER